MRRLLQWNRHIVPRSGVQWRVPVLLMNGRGCPDSKDGKYGVHSSEDWHEEVGEFCIEPSVYALYFTYRGSGSMDWLWFEFYRK